MKWGGKERVNWTITKEAAEILKEATKNNKGRSQSDLVTHAILNTYKNPLDEAIEKMRYHQTEFMRWKDKREKLEEERR